MRLALEQQLHVVEFGRRSNVVPQLAPHCCSLYNQILQCVRVRVRACVSVQRLGLRVLVDLNFKDSGFALAL